MQFDQGQFDVRKIIFDILIYGFLALFIGISQTAGIGGGPILNITLMVAFGYSTKNSMAITYLFLLGGSFASIYSSYGKKLSKKSNINLVDYDLVLLTMPLTISGTMFGTIFNHYLSQFIITIMFTFLLVYLTKSSYQKYKQVLNEPPRDELLLNQQDNFEMIDIQNNKPKINQKLQKILQQENKSYPSQKVTIMIYIMIITLVVILIKGSKNLDSIIGVQTCGFWSWIFILLHFTICYYFSTDIANKKQILDQKKIKLGYVFQQKKRMQKSFINLARMLGFAGGFVGGLLGLGGAIILVPGWLSMGIDHKVAVSTSPPLIFCSAIISIIVALLCGLYHSLFQMIFHLLLGFFASFYVKKLITYIKQLYKLQGMIFILLMLVMVLSLIFLLPNAVIRFSNDPQKFIQFDELC